MVNFVALLGWSPEDNEELMTLEELVQKFDYHHINKAPAVFDYTKLKWMNGEYIKKLPYEVFKKTAEPILLETVKRDCDKEKILHMVQSRIEILNGSKAPGAASLRIAGGAGSISTGFFP